MITMLAFSYIIRPYYVIKGCPVDRCKHATDHVDFFQEKQRNQIQRPTKTITEVCKNVYHLVSCFCTHSGRKNKSLVRPVFHTKTSQSSSITQCSMDHLINQQFKAKPHPT